MELLGQTRQKDLYPKYVRFMGGESKNTKLISFKGVDIQREVTKNGLKLPPNSVIYLFGNDNSLTLRQTSLAEKLGIEMFVTNKNRDKIYQEKVGKERNSKMRSSVIPNGG